MARITRRSVLAEVAAAATVAGAVRSAGALPTMRNKIVALSDVHIGDNSPTVWYQKKFHEPYLSALFDHVIANASSIQEMVILGDFVDFWTYPPDRRPPSFAEIMAANPNILGPSGKLSAVLTALGGRVSYVPGNHEMSITQADLDLIQNPQRYKVQLHAEENYFPRGAQGRLLMAHGHRWTMFNAPDMTTRLAPLPVGHFATRAFCHLLSKKLKPGQTVADLAHQGQPNGVDFGDMIKSLDAIDGTVVELAVAYASNTTGLAMDRPIILPNGDSTTLAEAKQLYRTMWGRWEASVGGGRAGDLEAGKAGAADIRNGMYLAWFAQRAALQNGADLVVFGHTHEAVRGVKEGFTGYLNTGFDCASVPDLATRHFTFVEVDTAALSGQIMQVASDFSISELKNAKVEAISPGLTFDYSTYVTVDNRAGAADLVLSDTKAREGHFVVPPPARIARGTMARFWIQDFPGGHGSGGGATYQGASGPVTLHFACPTGMQSNKASGAPFRCKTGSDNYGKLNDAPHFGHPFFVQFVT